MLQESCVLFSVLVVVCPYWISNWSSSRS